VLLGKQAGARARYCLEGTQTDCTARGEGRHLNYTNLEKQTQNPSLEAHLPQCVRIVLFSYISVGNQHAPSSWFASQMWSLPCEKESGMLCKRWIKPKRRPRGAHALDYIRQIFLILNRFEVYFISTVSEYRRTFVLFQNGYVFWMNRLTSSKKNEAWRARLSAKRRLEERDIRIPANIIVIMVGDLLGASQPHSRIGPGHQGESAHPKTGKIQQAV